MDIKSPLVWIGGKFHIGVEQYYAKGELFTTDDHQRLADLLNATTAKVALSYYPHELLDELYPQDKWRRVTWQTPKHSEKVVDKNERQYATEMLLMNYKSLQLTLWD